MVGLFQQLCDKSQEWTPLAVCVLPLGPDCDTYIRPAGASEFCCTKPTILTATGYTIDVCSPLTILCSSLLLCWLLGSGQGAEACWWGSALGFHGLPSSYPLILSKRNPRSFCVPTFGNSYGKKSVSLCCLELWTAPTSLLYLIDWLVYAISLEQDGMMLKMHYNQSWNFVGIPLLKLKAIYTVCYRFVQRGAEKLGMPNF